MSGNRPTLSDLLRRHDPARGAEGLSDEERARMRRMAVRAVASPSGSPIVPRWVLAGMVSVVVAGAGIGLWARLRQSPLQAPPVGAGLMEARAHSRRELHIVTPGGTQVVWVLDSEFKL